MPATTATTQAATLDIEKMTEVQKLAALLIVLGPDSAAQVLKGLDEDEMRRVITEMANLPMVDQDLQREILQEFSEVALTGVTAIRGGVDYAKTTLEKALGSFKAMEILGRVVPGAVSVSSMQKLGELDKRQLFNVLKEEKPQAIALVLSFLAPEKSSAVLSQLREDIRGQVVERLATLGPAPIEAVEKLGELLGRKVSVKSTRGVSQTGGLKPAATVLNAMKRDLSKTILASLEQRNPELSTAIRNKMFTFEDMIILDKAALQKIMREVDARALATALKSASETLKAKLLSGLSKRAAETVNEEISFLDAVKPKEVEAAQLAVIEIVRRLEDAGEIELGQNQATERDD
jgi:flagellar motor switch protein FliG